MAYNRKRYLAGAIRSVLDQTLAREHFEILLIKNFNDPEVDTISEENNIVTIEGGETPIGWYIHDAISKASGDVVCFLDDDDVFEPDKLERIYTGFTEHPDLVYYKNEWSLIDRDGKAVSPSRSDGADNETINYFDAEHAIRNEKRVYRWNMSCISARKTVFSGFEKFVSNIQSGQDLSVFYMAALKGGTFAHDRKKLTRYRLHEASMTKIKGEENDSYREYISLRDLRGYVSSAPLEEDILRTVTKLRVLSVWDGSSTDVAELGTLFRTSLSLSSYGVNDLKLVLLSGTIYFLRMLMGRTGVDKLRRFVDPFWSYEGKF